MKCRRVSVLLVLLAGLALVLHTANAEETTPIYYLDELPSRLDIGLLRLTGNGHGQIAARLREPGRAIIELRPGALFISSGGQGMMAGSGARGSVGGSIRSPVRHATATMGKNFIRASSGDAQSAGGWVLFDIELVCVERDRPDPTSETRWRIASPDIYRREPRWQRLRDDVRQIAAALHRLDHTVGELATSLRARADDRGAILSYHGEPMTAAAAQLFHATDWSASPDGRVEGQLNRDIVLRFAVWARSDGATENDLTRYLMDPRRRREQQAERSLRWAVERLLTEAGLDATDFVRPPQAAGAIPRR